MTTKFDQVCELIKADYLARISTAVDITWKRGQLERAKNAEAKRIVFVRDSGILDPSKFSSSLESSPITARLENVAAHIFAPDDEQAEAILEDLIRSYDIVLGNAWHERAGEYEWFTQTEEGARHEARGSLVRLMTQWRLTVSETASTCVQLEGQTHTESLGLGAFSPGFSRGFRYAGGHEAAH